MCKLQLTVLHPALYLHRLKGVAEMVLDPDSKGLETAESEETNNKFFDTMVRSFDENHDGIIARYYTNLKGLNAYL